MSWHLDKKLMIAMIAALVGNTATVTWWASGVTRDVAVLSGLPQLVSNNEKAIVRLEAKSEVLDGVIGEFKVVVKDLAQVVEVIGREQARRTPMVNKVENEMSGGYDGKR